MEDPRDLAVRRFGQESPLMSALDVITRAATDPPIVIASLLDALRPAAEAGGTIAELGFGSGWLLDAMMPAFPDARIVGLDLSRPMAQRALLASGGAVRVVLGDMERLPFAEASLAAIVTCWTLYFMRDIDAAIDGMRRCLRPGGIFVAATVAPDNMREYEVMGAAAARAAGADPAPDIGGRFDLVSGEGIVRGHLDDVEVLDWRGELVVRDIESMLALWDPYGPDVPPATHDRAFAAFRESAAAHLRSHGELRITRHSAAFVARA
jgi:SAM-dependent methyltransferase